MRSLTSNNGTVYQSAGGCGTFHQQIRPATACFELAVQEPSLYIEYIVPEGYTQISGVAQILDICEARSRYIATFSSQGRALSGPIEIGDQPLPFSLPIESPARINLEFEIVQSEFYGQDNCPAIYDFVAE